MKNLLILPIVVVLFLGGVVGAQTQEDLPKAGITPESPFYFLDRFGEALREFFTFNPEGKAKLQITFAAERVAEIKVMLETKGVQAKGLAVAQERLQEHSAKAADIVEQEKAKGKEVSRLAGEIVDNFHAQRKAAKQAFEEAKEEFHTEKRRLHEELKAARQAGDTEAQERIRGELARLEAAKDEAEAKKDATIEALEAEKDRLQDELEEQKKLEDETRDAAEDAQEAIAEAEEEKQDVTDEAVEEGVELSTAVFAEFDSLLAQAKNAFAAGNYKEARQLAKQAEEALDDVEETVEQLQEEQDEKADEEEEREDEDNEDVTQKNPETLVVPLAEQNSSGESGTATLKNENGKTKVRLELNGAPETPQPAHIHTGSCQNLGGVKYPLASVVDGESETLLDVPLAQILSELPLAANVHKSSDEIGVYVACGNIVNF